MDHLSQEFVQKGAVLDRQERTYELEAIDVEQKPGKLRLNF